MTYFLILPADENWNKWMWNRWKVSKIFSQTSKTASISRGIMLVAFSIACNKADDRNTIKKGEREAALLTFETAIIFIDFSDREDCKSETDKLPTHSSSLRELLLLARVHSTYFLTFTSICSINKGTRTIHFMNSFKKCRRESFFTFCFLKDPKNEC